MTDEQRGMILGFIEGFKESHPEKSGERVTVDAHQLAKAVTNFVEKKLMRDEIKRGNLYPVYLELKVNGEEVAHIAYN